MAEGLQFAGGGASGGSQTGIIQQGYRPPQTPITPPESPIIAVQPPAVGAGAILEWNGTEWTEPKLTGAFAALTPGAKIEGEGLQGRTEMAGHMARLKGTATVKAAEKLEPGEALVTIPAAIRPTAGETIPWSTTSGTYIEVKVNAAGNVTVATALEAGVAVNLTGLEYELV